MDFLATVKQKLQELEEHARLMEAQAQGGVRPLSGLKKAEQRTQGGHQKSGKGKNRGRQQQSVPHLASGEDFQTPICPTEGMSRSSGRSLPPAGHSRLVDDLHGRLDEAFLLSEILGPPRCLRGWDE